MVLTGTLSLPAILRAETSPPQIANIKCAA